MRARLIRVCRELAHDCLEFKYHVLSPDGLDLSYFFGHTVLDLEFMRLSGFPLPARKGWQKPFWIFQGIDVGAV